MTTPSNQNRANEQEPSEDLIREPMPLKELIPVYLPITAGLFIFIGSIKAIVYNNMFDIPFFNFAELSEVFYGVINMLIELKYFILITLIVLLFGNEFKNWLRIKEWNSFQIFLALISVLLVIVGAILTYPKLGIALCGIVLYYILNFFLLQNSESETKSNVVKKKKNTKRRLLITGIILVVGAYVYYKFMDSIGITFNSIYANIAFLLALIYLSKFLFGIVDTSKSVQRSIIIPGAIILFSIFYSFSTAKEDIKKVARGEYYNNTVIIFNDSTPTITTNDLCLYIGQNKSHLFIYNVLEKKSVIYPIGRVKEVRFAIDTLQNKILTDLIKNRGKR